MRKLWRSYWQVLIWGLVIFSVGYSVTSLILLTKNNLNEKAIDQSATQNQSAQQVVATATPAPRILTVETMLEYRAIDQLIKKQPGETTILVTGDVLLARSVNAKIREKYDSLYPLAQTQKELASGDITFINLETPLTSNCKVTTVGMSFCGDVENVEGLKTAGVDVVNFANNHAGNQGGDGIVSTISALRNAGMSVAGVGDVVVMERNGKKFGFLGFDDIPPRTAGISWADPEDVRAQIRTAKSRVDFLIVQFHWGVEYTNKATPQQKQLAHLAVDAGADLIVGNHPHWVQGLEFYKGKLIAYSHGNFIFDQQWSKETTEGVVGKYVFSSSGLVDVQYYPVIMTKDLTTHWADQTEAAPVLDRMRGGSIK